MKRILKLIEQRQVQIADHDLLVFMKDDKVAPEERLRFAPRMLYFLMGFKDILDSFYREKATSDLDRMVNAYCKEDGHHWLWYLQDLEKLGFRIDT